jgi:predicted ester cyclase
MHWSEQHARRATPVQAVAPGRSGSDLDVEHAIAPFGRDAPGRVHGPSHAREVVEWLTAQFPDLEMTFESLVAEGDMVAVRVRATGTNRGKLGGVAPPTNRRFVADQSHWYRVTDGRLCEHWATRDDLSTMVQLGVIQPPGRPARAGRGAARQQVCRANRHRRFRVGPGRDRPGRQYGAIAIRHRRDRASADRFDGAGAAAPACRTANAIVQALERSSRPSERFPS